MEDRWITDWEPSKRFPLYTRANSGEILPNLLALSAGILFGKQESREAGLMVVTVGGLSLQMKPTQIDLIMFPVSVGMCISMLVSFACRAFDPPGMSAEAMDAAFLGNHPDVPPYVPQEGDERPDLTAKIEETSAWVMSLEELPEELTEDREKILSIRSERPDLDSISDLELVERARSMIPVIREFLNPIMCMERHLLRGLQFWENCAEKSILLFLEG